MATPHLPDILPERLKPPSESTPRRPSPPVLETPPSPSVVPLPHDHPARVTAIFVEDPQSERLQDETLVDRICDVVREVAA